MFCVDEFFQFSVLFSSSIPSWLLFIIHLTTIWQQQQQPRVISLNFRVGWFSDVFSIITLPSVPSILWPIVEPRFKPVEPLVTGKTQK
jgi:hypothetical protein